MKGKLQTYREEKEALGQEQSSLFKEKTRLELTIKDLRDEVEGDDSSRKRAERELERLKDTISVKLTQLEDIRPRYDHQKKREEECTRS